MPHMNGFFQEEDGKLRLFKWAHALDVVQRIDGESGLQLLGVETGPRPVAMAHSESTGEAAVTNGTLGGDIIRLAAGTGFAPHTHPGDHLLVVLAGEGTVTYEGKIYPTRAGEVYMVEGAKAHAVGAITDHVILAIGHPHKPVGSEERLTLVDYTDVLAELGTLHCLICDLKAEYPARLRDMGCPHDPVTVSEEV